MTAADDTLRALAWVHRTACVPQQHDEACVALNGLLDRLAAVEASVERVTVLCGAIESAADTHEHLARLSTKQVRAALGGDQ